MTTTSIVSLIADPIDTALLRHCVPGEDPSWMAGTVVLPTHDGSRLQWRTYVSLTLASPIIGAEPPSATAVVDLRQLRDESIADRLVSTLLLQVRELQSQMLEEASPDKQVTDFSDLIGAYTPSE